MSEFEIFQWKKEKLDSEVPRAIRHDARLYRRERGRGGHRFRFSTLKNVWAVDEIWAVLNHKDDPIWQLWHNHGRHGWILVDWRLTRREAQALAELPLAVSADLVVPQSVRRPGWYVIAGEKEYTDTIDVACSSEEIADDIKEVFHNIDFWAAKGQVISDLLHLYGA
jgi:hypothetical protein